MRRKILQLHEINLPQKILVGKNALEHVGKICLDLKINKKVAVLTGPNVKNIVGEKVCNIISDNGIESELYVVKESSIEEAESIYNVLSHKNIEIIIGVGGGKIIDISKLVSRRKGIPYMSIPTAASHDGIASPIASIKESNNVTSIISNPPLSVIADVDVITRAPYRLTASGCADVLAKFTSIKDWKLAKDRFGEYYGEYAASLALMSATLVLKHRKGIRALSGDSIRTVIEALISCGIAMCIAGSSRPCSGSEHLFSHALDVIAKKPALHGEQCGIGTIMMMYLHGGNWKRIRETLSTIGAPTTAKELGVEENEIIEALVKAREIRKNRYTILNERKLTLKEAEKIATITGVIRE